MMLSGVGMSAHLGAPFVRPLRWTSDTAAAGFCLELMASTNAEPAQEPRAAAVGGAAPIVVVALAACWRRR
jgi:hypothetical protein